MRVKGVGCCRGGPATERPATGPTSTLMGAQTRAAYDGRAGVPVTMAPTRNNGDQEQGEPQEAKVWGWAQQPGCVPLSRKVFRKWLARVNASHWEEDATLCFMELLTNAIRIPSPTGLTNTKWLLYEDKLRVEVSDYSPNAPYLSYVDEDSESGRGLILVHLLADKWGYEHTTFLGEHGEGWIPGKVVWFELHK